MCVCIELEQIISRKNNDKYNKKINPHFCNTHCFFKVTIVEINKAPCVVWETELALQHKRWARAAHPPFQSRNGDGRMSLCTGQYLRKSLLQEKGTKEIFFPPFYGE